MTSKTLQGLAVLVVEDNDTFSKLLKDEITNRGGDVICVQALADTLEAVKRASFDIVLLDNFLPDGFGESIIPQINASSASPPLVIMMTADTHPDTIQSCFSAGAYDYFIKPLSTELAMAKISRTYQYIQTNRRVIEQTNALEAMLAEQANEQKLASFVYQHMIEADMQSIDGIKVEKHYDGDFCGDFICIPNAPADRIYVFVIDAMGHGLAAAFCILPTLEVTQSMVGKGKSLYEIFYEVNAKLNRYIPDDRFVAMAGLELNINKNSIDVINAGLPDVFVGMATGAITSVKSTAMPLGILSPSEFSVQNTSFHLDEVSQIGLYTDGLLEQSNEFNERISHKEFATRAQLLHRKGHSFTELMQTMLTHKGRQALDDDASVCAIDCIQLRANLGSKLHHYHEQKNAVAQCRFGGVATSSFCFSGRPLGNTDIVQMVIDYLNNVGVHPELSQKVFTVLSELVLNAIDHGILNLDSALKEEIDGFAIYLQERENRLNSLSHYDLIRINVEVRKWEEICITVTDTGQGFSSQTVNQKEASLFSGRGLMLVESLSQSVSRNAAGNSTTVVLSRT